MNSKILKIILIINIILMVFTGIAFATESDNEVTPESALDKVATVTNVTSLSNLPEANLGLNNILNVILISIGILLILFAIAILIRLKK